MRLDPSTIPAAIAAVDLGSNSFHMIVARTGTGEPVVVDRLREMVQLASGLDERKRLAADAQERALACLKRFGQRVSHMAPATVRAVGTNTLRSAHDIDDFLVQAEEALGHPIETISGMEEARLIYLGVAHSLPDPAARRLVVDIGGGSTELIIGRRFQPMIMDSLYMGCVTSSRRWFAGGEIDADRFGKAVLAARQELEPAGAAFVAAGWDQAVGASGTVRSVNAVAEAAGWCKSGLTLKALKKVRDTLCKAGHVEQLRLEGLSPARRWVFPGGLALLLATFEALGIERMLPSDGALREGLLYDLLGRIREEDVRSRSVAALADRYHVDPRHAGRVEHTALTLLDRVMDAWDLGDAETRQLLRWACQLHAIGLDIAHQHYHRHGEYIVGESDLFGFTREEQRFLATLVRAQRRKFPVATFKQLRRRRSRTIERVAILLRLAVLLHRSRNPEMLPVPELSAGKRSLKLQFPSAWLDEHPLTTADLETERTYLKAAGYRLEFE